MRRLAILGLAVLAALAVFGPWNRSAATAAWPTTTQQSEYSTLAYSCGAHERLPHGVPSNYSWYGGSICPGVSGSWGNSPGVGFTYGDPYGEVYTAADGNPQPSAKVEICHLQAWVLDGSDVWHSLYGPSSDAKVGGQWYTENWSSASTSVGTYDWASYPGCLVVGLPSGYLFHDYPNQARASIPASTVHGVVAVAQVRIEPNSYDPSKPLPGIAYLSGFDFWNSPSGGTAHSAGQGRFMTVLPTWRTVTFSTLTLAQLHAGLLPPFTFDPSTLY